MKEYFVRLDDGFLAEGPTAVFVPAYFTEAYESFKRLTPVGQRIVRKIVKLSGIKQIDAMYDQLLVTRVNGADDVRLRTEIIQIIEASLIDLDFIDFPNNQLRHYTLKNSEPLMHTRAYVRVEQPTIHSGDNDLTDQAKAAVAALFQIKGVLSVAFHNRILPDGKHKNVVSIERRMLYPWPELEEQINEVIGILSCGHIKVIYQNNT